MNGWGLTSRETTEEARANASDDSSVRVHSPGSIAAIGLLILAALFTAYVARPLILPIVLGIGFGIPLAPVVAGLKRLHLPEPIGAALILLGALALTGSGFYALSGPVAEWATKLPASFRRLEERVRDFRKPVEAVKKTAAEVDKMTNVRPPADRPAVVEVKQPGFFDTVLSDSPTVLAGAAMMYLTLYFSLASGDLFVRKLVRVLPHRDDKERAVEIVREIKRQISAYFLTITIINALLWAVMVFVLNYVPYVGPLTGIAVLTVVVAATFPNLSRVLLVPGAYLLAHGLEANVLTPLVLGRRLTLNPFAIFLWLSLWFWIWGIAGALLAVPMLQVFKILCDNLTPLHAVGEFLDR